MPIVGAGASEMKIYGLIDRPIPDGLPRQDSFHNRSPPFGRMQIDAATQTDVGYCHRNFL